MCSCAIDIDFLKNWEFHLEGFFCPVSDEICRSGFLGAKLVAWESENLEAFAGILFVEINHLGVVDLGVTAFGSDVDEKSTFHTMHLISDCGSRLRTVVIHFQ